MALCALFAALTAVFSQFQFAIGLIPINFATFSVLLAGGLLGPTDGAVSMCVYVLLGAVGAPVFSGFSGGFQRIAGPTGGYIVGYIVAAFFAGSFIGLLNKKTKSIFLAAVLSFTAALTACYILGTAWYMVYAKCSFGAALSACVYPFLIGDTIKIFAAALLTKKLYGRL